MYCVATTVIQDGNFSIVWEEVQTIPSTSGVEPDISVCQDTLVAIFRCGRVIQEISAIVSTLKGNTVTWHPADSLKS